MDRTPHNVVDFEDALAVVAEKARAASSATRKVELLPLLRAAGRVLAAPVFADRDQPPFDRSTRDGFAVHAEQLAAGDPLDVLGQLRAGELWLGPPLRSGSALEIMTGAPLPAGANAVVMVEHVARESQSVRLAAGRAITPGENIVRQGSEARAGEQVLAAGVLIGAPEIAVAASYGCAQLRVYAQPRVAIVATGDELVELDQPLAPAQIRNSNSYALAAMTSAAGGHPERLAIARDLRDDVRERVAQGRMADLLLFSGGVSMGEYDLVEEVLAEFSADFFFTGVKMQPGKPVVFGRLPGLENPTGPAPECYFFGLPGNPISTQVTFHCFVEPFLRALAGQREPVPRWVQATLADDVAAKPGLTRLLPARMEGVQVKTVAWQGSGDLAANARANCYAELLPDHPYRGGEVVRVLLR